MPFVAMDQRAEENVPYHIDARIVVGSYLVSLAGTCLAVELLHVRTALKGYMRWIELAACSYAMGLVGIWAMHYIGNRSIVLGDGLAASQLVYSPGWTALSAFIPMLALFFAFAVADRRYKGGTSFFLCLFAPGVGAGAAICGMHYVGSYGIVNYRPHFEPGYVAGSVLLAGVACVAALSGLFILQDLWMSSFSLRLFVAVVLAATVSGMHWVATLGTTYTTMNGPMGDFTARATNSIIAAVVSSTTIPMFGLVWWWKIKRQRQLADRAQQVVLACARFDPDGRLLITQDGHLPCQKITIDHNEMTFEDDFDTSHPAFKWIFRASHNWHSVSRFVPRMRRHLREARFSPSSRTESERTAFDAHQGNVQAPSKDNYSILFRESFCVAADDLAQDLKTNLDELGNLYEEVMMTGTRVERMLLERYKWLRKFGITLHAPARQITAQVGFDLFGKGQLLVLASRCSRREALRGVDGYRFEPLDKVVERLAKNMQIPCTYLEAHLKKLKQHADGDHLAAPRGTLLGLFAIRPGVHHSFEVVVRREYHDRLPYVQLSPKELNADALAVLQQLDGLTVSECCEMLDEKTEADDLIELPFAHALRQRIDRLYDMVSEPFFRQAVFSSKIVKVPTFDSITNAAATCNLVVFHIIPDVHSPSLKSSASMAYTPLSLFKCRQQCLRGAPHHGSFERKVHHELETMFASTGSVSLSVPPKANTRSSGSNGSLTPRPNSAWWMPKSPITSASDLTHSKRRSSASQDLELDTLDKSEGSGRTPFGGILISQDVTVEAEEPSQRMNILSLPNYGTRAYVVNADVESPTYVDELYTIAADKWKRTLKMPK